jgi:hypothetical protein
MVVPGGIATAFDVVALLRGTAQNCVSGPERPLLCSAGPSTLHNVVTIALVGFCFFGPIFTAVYLARRAR